MTQKLAFALVLGAMFFSVRVSLAQTRFLLRGTGLLSGAAQASPSSGRAPRAAAKDAATAAEPPPEEFSVAVAENALKAFRQALLAGDPHRAMALFDPSMPGYDELANQLALLFSRYDSLRVYDRITQTATEAGRGVAIAEFTVEAEPPEPSRLPVRRSAELRFAFARVGKTWKIVALQPRDFFASF